MQVSRFETVDGVEDMYCSAALHTTRQVQPRAPAARCILRLLRPLEVAVEQLTVGGAGLARLGCRLCGSFAELLRKRLREPTAWIQ